MRHSLVMRWAYMFLRPPSSLLLVSSLSFSFSPSRSPPSSSISLLPSFSPRARDFISCDMLKDTEFSNFYGGHGVDMEPEMASKEGGNAYGIVTIANATVSISNSVISLLLYSFFLFFIFLSFFAYQYLMVLYLTRFYAGVDGSADGSKHFSLLIFRTKY